MSIKQLMSRSNMNVLLSEYFRSSKKNDSQLQYRRSNILIVNTVNFPALVASVVDVFWT
jgi:hypothetical protein